MIFLIRVSINAVTRCELTQLVGECTPLETMLGSGQGGRVHHI